MKNKKGFTMIELLAVIAVMGIISGIVVVNVSKYKKQLEIKNKENILLSIFEGAKMRYIKTHDTKAVKVYFLKLENYVQFDSKYDSLFLLDSPDNKTYYVTRKQCKNDSNKYYYTLTNSSKSPKLLKLDNKVSRYYSDCGCEVQNNGASKNICTYTSTSPIY